MSSQKVLLTNKDVIPARVLKNTEETTTVESEPGATPREYEKSEVAFINPESWRLGKGFKFTGNINAAMELERGNTDNDEYDFDGQGTIRRLKDRLRFWGEAEIDRSQGDLTKQKWKVAQVLEHLVFHCVESVLESFGDSGVPVCDPPENAVGDMCRPPGYIELSVFGLSLRTVDADGESIMGMLQISARVDEALKNAIKEYCLRQD